MAVLVTGASGNVGAHIVKQLSQQGLACRAALLASAIKGYQPAAAVSPVVCEFGKDDTYAPALAGVKRVFLMRPPHITDARRCIFPFIEAAKRAGVEQIVFLSLLGAEKNRIVPHRKIEDYLLTCGVPYTFLRASFFMQNLSTTHLPEIRRMSKIFVPAGNGKTSFIDARDIAAVAVHTLTEDGHANRAYPLTGAEALDYHQAAAALSKAAGRTITYAKPGLLRFAHHMWRERGLPLPFVLTMGAIYTTARLGWAGLVTPDTGRILGRAPVRIEQFALDYQAVWTE